MAKTQATEERSKSSERKARRGGEGHRKDSRGKGDEEHKGVPRGRRDQRAHHALSPEESLEALDARREGLESKEASRRLEEHGENRLGGGKEPKALPILLGQFKSIVILVLLAAGVVAALAQRWPETIAIVAVVLVNTAIGFASEWSATRSMEALRRIGEHAARVRREGSEVELPAAEIVPGDIVLLDADDTVPADLRLLDVDELAIDEAALTGESLPVSKDVEAVAEEAETTERSCVAHKGTKVVNGKAEGVAYATGPGSELGHIAELAEEAEEAAAPLQQRLDHFARRLAGLVFVIAAVVAGIGLAAGRDPLSMIETAIALGIAAVPEGLPIVATIALARGMWVMAQHRALIRRLPAVETLGATTVIATDKTGTLTENRMHVRGLATPEEEWSADELNENEAAEPEALAEGRDLAARALRVTLLCNDAELADPGQASESTHEENAGRPEKGQGDEGQEGDAGSQGRGEPMELAMLALGRRLGVEKEDVEGRLPRVHEHPFSRERLMMATLHEEQGSEGSLLVAVKGAPEAVFDACSRVLPKEGGESEPFDQDRRAAWDEKACELGARGLRLLALAERQVESAEDEAFEELTLLALVTLADPPREGVREAIDACQAAGIRAVMVTGDKPETAEAVARECGLVGGEGDEKPALIEGREIRALREGETDGGDGEESLAARFKKANIFARVTPEQKLDLVGREQEEGEVVAMTGDGINDAAALKKADIGIAMGRRGTDAARGAADMVLQDDALSTIVEAVRHGRIVFDNIRRAVLFMLCTNGAEVLAVAIAAMLPLPLPLKPLQILYLNVLTDVLPALALAFGAGPEGVMRQKPRSSDEGLLTRSHWLGIGASSVVIAAAVLGGLIIAQRSLGLEEEAAVTVSFLTLGLAKLWFVLNLRPLGSRLLVNEITTNPFMGGAIVTCLALLAAALYLGPLAALLDARPLELPGLGLALAASVVPLIAGQLWHLFAKRS